MKKVKNLFMLAFVALAFMACSDNDEITDGNNGNGNGNESEAWLSLSIRPSGTRALHSPDQENGTADETKVNGGLAILFDGFLPTSKVVSVVPLTSAYLGDPGQPSGTPGEAFQVSASAKSIMVVVNPPTGFSAAVGQEYTGVVNSIKEATDVTDLTGAGYDDFMMTNARGTLEPYSGNTASTLPLKTSKNDAQNSPLQITVDRVVAKVRLYVNSATSTANIYGPEWVLNVTNRKYYPISERTMTQLELNYVAQPQASPNSGGYVWSDPYQLGSYRKDPNYDTDATVGGTAGPTGAIDPTVYNQQYFYYTDASQPSSWGKPTDDGTAPKTYYCLENTQAAAYNYHAYTTHVLFKANFAPKGLKANPSETVGSVTVGENDDWMIVNGAYFTYTTLMTFLEDELTKKYNAGTPANYNTPISNAFNEYIKAILGTSEGINIPDDLASGGYADVNAAITDLITNGFAAKQNAIEASANRAATVGTVTYYAAGVSYYKIMIQHANNDINSFVNQLGEFGVVRNSVYDVNITSINNPGYPKIPDPDGKTPDENDKLWLSVEIDINPWTWYTQNAQL